MADHFLYVCVSPSRPSFCNTGHQWQVCQRSDGSRSVVTKPQHNQETCRPHRTSCCRTLQVMRINSSAIILSLALKSQTIYSTHTHWHTSYFVCCRDALRSIFDEVCVVDVMDSGDAAHLSLMKRPDLGVTFTKLHCWTLTQYSKCVFMDADTLVRNEQWKITV